MIQLVKQLIKKKFQDSETIASQTTIPTITKNVTNVHYSNLILNKASLEDGPWVAGGSVRKVWFDLPWQNQDVDFFCANETQFKSLTDSFKKDGQITHESSNAITYIVDINNTNFKIQLIRKRFYLSYTDLLNDFDFNISQFVTDGNVMLATVDAIKDCNDNKIRMNKNTNKNVNSRRLLKYTAYGFDPEPKLLIKAIKSIKTEAYNVDEEY